MRIKMGDLKKRLLKEETEGTPAWKPEETGWSVKPGQILVRSVMEPPSAWRWEFIPERILFKRSELKKAPRGPTARQVWVFERAGMLYAVHEGDFYRAPAQAWDHIYPSR